MSEELRDILNKIIESGYQISVDGFEYLKTLKGDDLNASVKKALRAAETSPKRVVILDKEFLQRAHEETAQIPDPLRLASRKPRIRPMASEHDPELKLLDKPPAEPSGDIEGFVDYFRSRFRKIERILRQRIDVRNAVTIGSALKMPLKAKMKVIGIVTDRRTSGHRLFLEIEDSDDSVTVMASDSDTVRRGLSVVQDQVICVDAVKYRQDLLIANDFIWPDIPSKPPNRSEIPLCAAFLADVHVGSVQFQKELFDRFIRWMNMELGPPQFRRLAGRVKYLIIGGDLVDGIGVYPNQLEELEIRDIRQQYEVAAMMLTEIPDHVEIIVLPGNHDAVRKSLPQEPISKEYAEALHENRKVHLYGNPSRIQLHGVEAFISHGKALDEILSHVPGMDFNNPVNGMELLLRCRHVAPIYGNSTPIAPEREDRLVIGSTPDVFQMGHIHVHGVRKYKGATLISSGSWQEQTPYQKRVNLTPTVGVVPIMDLQTHVVVPIDFKKLG
ncbi:MAG: DNA-directed DNA polymerase II small subunit [Candidatus Bathyarchaeota archaeon]|nr:MAG: DNA-directed DNA polymerase II small subunit [Candidatus Bathyarchaeota archaeon]